MAREGDRMEIVLEASACPEGRHRPQMRACAWRDDQPCLCRARIAIEDLLGGRIGE